MLILFSVFYCLTPSVYSIEDYSDYIQWDPLLSIFRRNNEIPNYNETFFSSLLNYHVNAMTVSDVTYPWLAKVIHSRSANLPYVCTAVCIAKAVFITAARCVDSKQMFDDIALMVVDDELYTGPWKTMEIIDTVNRTDETFQWYANLNLEDKPKEHKVVGYASDMNISKAGSLYANYSLTELDVVVGFEMCKEILTFNNAIKGFSVPCYHSCTLQEFKTKSEECNRYHGVEGGALFNTRTNKLLGVATWGPHFRNYYLPVGFSVPNSEIFFHDYNCALKIRDNSKIITDNYQSLCDTS